MATTIKHRPLRGSTTKNTKAESHSGQGKRKKTSQLLREIDRCFDRMDILEKQLKLEKQKLHQLQKQYDAAAKNEDKISRDSVRREQAKFLRDPWFGVPYRKERIAERKKTK